MKPTAVLVAQRLAREPPAHQRLRLATKLKPVGSTRWFGMRLLFCIFLVLVEDRVREMREMRLRGKFPDTVVGQERTAFR